MLHYVDSFFLTRNSSKKTYVIRFRQEEPIENSESESIDIQTNEVANIMLDQECALQLASSILELCKELPSDDKQIDTNQE